MIAHVVTFRWHEHVTDADVDRLEAALGELPAAVPAIKGYRFGRDLGLQQGNGDFAVVALPDDAEGFSDYQEHPVHARMRAEVIVPMVAERTAVQMTWDEGA